MTRKSKEQEIYLGLSLAPDVGELKGDDGSYGFSQNERGWGDFIKKRQGVQSRANFDSAIMGIYDLKIDGDARSPDKILIITGEGSFELIDFSELTYNFTFLLDLGVNLVLQSPNSSWWNVIPDSLGAMTSATTSAPASPLSVDLEVSANDSFGFTYASGIWKLSVDQTIAAITTEAFSTTPYETLYASLAFVTGKGVVIQTENLTRYRIAINNTGILSANPL